MTIYNQPLDPHVVEMNSFECRYCGTRISDEPRRCEECGSNAVMNIAVPRE
ncbi:MAG: hypothetical protein J07HQX50_01984 [Haloquadratum sp. J07HQX50]|nr:MAG: hypothetical protein J07HQX50_01984 [Haloquadratum sp. J07HQX50]